MTNSQSNQSSIYSVRAILEVFSNTKRRGLSNGNWKSRQTIRLSYGDTQIETTKESLQRYTEHPGIVGGTPFSGTLKSHIASIQSRLAATPTTTVPTIQQALPPKFHFWGIL